MTEAQRLALGQVLLDNCLRELTNLGLIAVTVGHDALDELTEVFVDPYSEYTP